MAVHVLDEIVAVREEVRVTPVKSSRKRAPRIPIQPQVVLEQPPMPSVLADLSPTKREIAIRTAIEDLELARWFKAATRAMSSATSENLTGPHELRDDTWFTYVEGRDWVPTTEA